MWLHTKNFISFEKYTNVDLKIFLHDHVYLKVILWKFRIPTPHNYRVILIYPSSLYFSDQVTCFKTSLQTHHVYSTLKKRWNDCFYIVLTWNARSVFTCFCMFVNKHFAYQKCTYLKSIKTTDFWICISVP